MASKETQSNQATTHQNGGFVGLDVYHPAWELKPSDLTQCDNAVWYGSTMSPRPAFIGQLAAKFPQGIAPVMIDFVDGLGIVSLIFVSGGKLYKFSQGASNAVEILNSVTGESFTFNDAGVRMARSGDWIYIVDGVGEMVRANLDGGAAYAGMNPPDTAIVPTLTNIPLDPATSITGWTDDKIEGGAQEVNLYPNNMYQVGIVPGQRYQGGQNAGGFTMFGPDLDFHNGGDGSGIPSGYPGVWMLPDDPGSGCEIQFGSLTTGFPGAANYPLVNDSLRYCRQFYISLQYYQDDMTSVSGVIAQLEAFDTLGNSIATVTAAWQPLYSASQVYGQIIDAVMDFPDVNMPEIGYVNLRILGAPTNQRAVSRIFISGVQLNAMGNQLFPVVAASGSGISLNRPVTGLTSTAAQYGKIGGCRLTKDYTTAQDWSGQNIIAVALTNATDLVANGLAMVFDFATDDGSGNQVHHYTNNCVIAPDGSYAAVDVGTIDPAVLAAFRWFGVCFTSDWTVTAVRNPWIVVAPVSASGNLSITTSGATVVNFAPYEWYFSESQVITVGDEIDSNPSPASVPINPTFFKAAADLQLPADDPVNAAATNYIVGREGGVFSDGLIRILASVPINADVAYGSDPLNPYYSWDHATKVFLDNTPDSWLVLADTMSTTNGVPPHPAQAIVAAGARIWLAVGSQLWASGVITGSAVYFNDLNLPNSPTLAIEGAEFQVGGSEYPIMALFPLGTSPADVEGTNAFSAALLALKRNTVWVVGGTNASNYNASEQPYAPGIGLMGPLLVCKESVFAVTFLAGDRLHLYPIYYRRHVLDVAALSQNVQPILYPGGASMTPPTPSAAMQGAFMCSHDNRILIALPDAGGATNTQILAQDQRTQGWQRWIPPVPITGLLSIPPPQGAGENYPMYAGGSDGQIYLLDPNEYGDLDNPFATPVPIVMTVATRGMGREGGYWKSVKARRAGVDASGSGNLVLTIEAVNSAQGYGANTFNRALAPVPPPIFECSGGVEGEYIVAVAAITCSGPVRLNAIMTATSPGRTGH